AEDRILSRSKSKLPNYRRTRGGSPCSRLFCGRRRVRAHVRPRRRGRRCGRRRKFGKHLGRETKRGAERLKGALDRAGRFPIPARRRKSPSAIRSDRSRSAIVHENEERIARRAARLPRITRARLQIVIERWIARDIFVLASRERSGVLANDRGRAGRCEIGRAHV